MRRGFWCEDTGNIFNGVSDEELVRLAAEKHPQAFSELLNRYTKLMLYKISCVKPAGDEAQDLMQECSLALLDAAESYSSDGKASFRTYAGVCIDNRLRSVMRRSETDKNKPLSGYMELSDYLSRSEGSGEVSGGTDPEEQILINESIAELHQWLKQELSELEYKVFTMYLAGRSYQDIAKSAGIAEKAVNNALQRVRRKLKTTQR